MNKSLDEVRITLENPGVDLRTDLSATADVITAVRPDVLAIPIIALTLIEPSEFERIPQEGEEVQQEDAAFRPVEVGIAGDNYFEVLSGLDEGTTVVSGTYQAIRELEDGAMIRIAGTGDNAPAEGPGDSE